MGGDDPGAALSVLGTATSGCLSAQLNSTAPQHRADTSAPDGITDYDGLRTTRMAGRPLL
jgi:hypothetical protein